MGWGGATGLSGVTGLSGAKGQAGLISPDFLKMLQIVVMALFWASAGATFGQVLEVSGGSSSLYQTQGGSILLHGNAYESEVGAGLISGRLVAGGHLVYRDKSTIYSAGVEEIRFDLPTDVFDSDHRLLGVGIGMKRVHPRTSLELFAGGSSRRFDTPLFTGVRSDHAAAAFILRHSFSPGISSTTQVLAANPGTALQSIEWKTKPWLVLAASGGLGGRSHYEAVSAEIRRPLVDVKTSYIDTARRFERVGAQPEISPEPVRENFLFTVRSSRNPRLTLTGGRQNFMVPAGSVTTPNGTVLPNLVSTSNQISASTKLREIGIAGTVIQSGYNGHSNLAVVLSASASPSQRVHIQSSFFQSRLLRQSALLQGIATNPVTNTVVTNIQEVLTRRFAVNQTITYSGGQTSVGYGGSILSNALNFSADYETFYVPTRTGNPFQQTLVLDIQVNLFGRVTLHGETFVSPTGKTLYTANMHAVESRSPTPSAPSERARFGAYMLQGRVIDSAGSPVYGAAIGLGQNIIFTDSDGAFFLRDTKPHTYVFHVLLDQFLDGRYYRVLSQPTQVTGVKAENQHLLIMVTRVSTPAQPSISSCDDLTGPRKKQASSSSKEQSSPCVAVSFASAKAAGTSR